MLYRGVKEKWNSRDGLLGEICAKIVGIIERGKIEEKIAKFS